MKKRLLVLMLIVLLPLTETFAHGVQVRWNIVPSTGAIRVWIEHWHGDAWNVSNFPLNVQYTVNGTTSTQTYYASGYINNRTLSGLPNGGSSSDLLSICGQGNFYNDWVYWDFNPPACNTPVSLTIISGPAVETAEACANLYPQTITSNFNDNTGPAITCNDITVSPANSCDAVVNSYGVSATDACGGGVTTSYSIPEGSTFSAGSTPVTVTATDQYGNANQCTFNVNVVDNEAPVVTCPANEAATTNIQGTATATISGNNQWVRNTGPTYSFADPVPAGAVITGVDVSYSVRYPYSCCVASTNVHIAGSAIGAVHTGSPAGIRTLTKSYTGSLPNYNYGGNNSFRMDSWWNGVYFQNATITFHYEGSSGTCGTAVVVAAPVANDNCGVSSIVNDFNSTADASGFYPVGTTNVNWTITDVNGNTSTCQQQVTVTDNTMPTVLTQDITVQLDLNGNASITAADIDNNSTDNCGIANLSVSPNSFSCKDIGANTVTLTATDIHGNVSTGTAQVTVEDAPAPVAVDDTLILNDCQPFTFTAADLLGNDSDPMGAGLKVDFVGQPTNGNIIDNGDDTYTYIPGSGSNGSLSVSYTVKRDDGTTVFPDNGHFYEFVPGYITWTNAKVAAEQRVYKGMQGYLATITSAAENGFAASKLQGQGWIGASDAAQEGTWKWVTGPEAGQQFWQGLYNGTAMGYHNWNGGEPNNWGDEDYAHFLTNGKWNDYPNPGGVIHGYLVEYGGMPGDCEVNATAEANITFEIQDVVAPTAVAQDITVQLDAGGNASIVAADVDNGSTDACGIASMSLSRDNFSCADIGVNTVTLTVADNNGNTASTTAMVTVVDMISPQVLTRDISVYLDAGGSASIVPSDVDNGSSDACGILSTSLDVSGFGCGEVGANTVQLTVEDNNGNTSTASAVVTVLDTIAPDVVTQNHTAYLDANGNVAIQPSDVDNGSSDACGIAGMSVSPNSFSCAEVGSNIVTLTVTDNNGNVSTAVAEVMVEDNVAPAAIAQDITVQLDASGNVSITAADVDNASNDACGIADLDLNITAFGCSDLGENEVILTATDVNGNQSTATAMVTVEDNIVPTITCPADISVVAQPDDCSPQVFWSAPTAWDNCSYNVTGSHAPGDRFEEGSTTVTYYVEDAAGNTASCSFEVNVTTVPLSLNISSPEFAGGWNVSCNAATDGSIDAEVAGGCLPYTYDWSNGSSDEDPSGIGAGTYDVTVTDAKGRVITGSITLTEPDPLVASISASPQYTVSSGVDAYTIYLGYGIQTIDLSGSTVGGTEAYSYQWSPAAGLSSTNTAATQASPTVPTNYTLTVTDVNGCVTSESFFVDVVDARCGKKLDKVLICHKTSSKGRGKTTTGYHEICVSPDAVQAHLAHGDKLGPCDDSNGKKSAAAEEDDLAVKALEYSIYPNPTTGMTSLKVETGRAVTYQIVVSDMSGKTLEIIEGGNTSDEIDYQLDMTNYRTGIYLLRIITPDHTYTDKVIKD